MTYRDTQAADSETTVEVPKITVLKRRSDGFSADLMRSLKSADEAAEAVHLSVDRLIHYADGNLCPHYRVEGRPLFDIRELQIWAAKNLLHRIEGAKEMRVTVLSSFEPVKKEDIPTQLKFMASALQQLPVATPSGVYFLCLGNEIVYVGQSLNPYQRIGGHVVSGKKFDRIFFIPVPAAELDWMESVMIHTLKPALNGRHDNGEFVAPIPRNRLHSKQEDV